MYLYYICKINPKYALKSYGAQQFYLGHRSIYSMIRYPLCSHIVYHHVSEKQLIHTFVSQIQKMHIGYIKES